MKGESKIIDILNQALADELTAISQYIVHSEMCANWNYTVLHEKIEQRAKDEMKHAESLIARILFLEGMPIVSKLNPMKIGKTIPEQLLNDTDAEAQAIKNYQNFIKVCLEVGDAGSRELLEDILKDEEDHIDWLEAQQDQIKQMGIENYLASQIHES
ncbi:MAG TPA: bacterioferritin [bacterium]